MTREELRAALRLPDGERFGDVMAPFQRAFFIALDSGTFRHFFAERPRGAAKSSDLSAEAVVELLAGPPGARLFVVASDKDQAGIVAELARGWALRTGLASVVRIERWRLIVPKKDSVLEVLAADAPGAYGRLPTWIGCDELSQWPEGYGEQMWTAMWSSAPKRQARVICISTPGWDKSSLAWQIREMARTSPHWHFSSLQEPAPWIDASWLDEQRVTLPGHVFERLHLGRWTDAGGAFLSSAEVDACFVEGLPVGAGQVAVGLDVGVSHDRCVLAAVRYLPDVGAVVEHLETWTPSSDARVDLREVEESAIALARKLGGAPLVVDPYQAILLSQRLQSRGVMVVEYAFTQEGRRKLFNVLLDLIRRGKLKSRPHEALRKELLALEVTETSAGWRVDHRPGRFDDHVIAVGLAAQAVARDEVVLRPEHFWAGPRRTTADTPFGDPKPDTHDAGVPPWAERRRPEWGGRA